MRPLIREPAALYLAGIVAIILIGLGSMTIFKDDLREGRRLAGEAMALQQELTKTYQQELEQLKIARSQIQYERMLMGKERQAHQDFLIWIVETFPRLWQAYRIEQLLQEQEHPLSE